MITTLIALAIALAAITWAGFCAAADGALLVEPAEWEPLEVVPARARERTHRALSFARMLGQITAGAALAWIVALHAPAARGRMTLLALVGMVVVALIDGTARALGDALGDRGVPFLRPVSHIAETVLAPVIALAARLEALVERVFPARTVEEEREATTEQFRQVVAAEAESEVGGGEAALINGVFSLGDTEVQEIMIPRVDIVGIARDTPWSQLLARVRSSEHARFPVFEETIDEVIGVLYAKDLLAPVLADEPPDDWTTLVRPAVFIPGTKTIDQQLREFKASRTHIAIVVDEYGGTAGLVTIEDVLEQIVGDIRDEYDVDEPDVESENNRRFWVTGRLPLDTLSEVLGEEFTSEDVTTVGGLVYEHLGRVPRAGEQFTLGHYRVIVERVRRRTVERVYFERIESLAGQPDE